MSEAPAGQHRPPWLQPSTASRADVERYLKAHGDAAGLFVVRSRTDAKRVYAIGQLLSSGDGKLFVRHFAVDKLPNGRLTVGDEHTFASIEELVQCYRTTPLPGGTTLCGYERRPPPPPPPSNGQQAASANAQQEGAATSIYDTVDLPPLLGEDESYVDMQDANLPR